MKQLIFTLILIITMSASVFAQEDAEGCKDHPLFNRMPNYFLESCEQKEFGLLQFPVGKPDPKNDNKIKLVDVEGSVFAYHYVLKEDATHASGLQIMRNFQNAAKKNGGSIEGEYQGWCTGYYSYISTLGDGGIPFGNGCTNWSTTIKFVKNNKETWVYVQYADDGYDMAVAEREAMKQEIQASDMFESLNKEGFIALYINFETGKADIKPESKNIIDQIVQMLKENPTLTISVEGHTDNVGNAKSNQKLSEDRAKSVVDAIVAQGIDAKRLSAVGHGQNKPIADNKTEEGRAKNRRVELVKKPDSPK